MRRLSSMASQGFVARFMLKRTLSSIGRMDGSPNVLSSPVPFVESRRAGGALAQLCATSRVGPLRCMGFGSFKEEHANAAVPDMKLEDDADSEVIQEESLEDIKKASEELFRQSNVIADPDEPLAEEVKEYEVKDHHAKKPHADIASEVYSAKEQDGTNPFLDDSDKVKSTT